jgi:hypothetical protein
MSASLFFRLPENLRVRTMAWAAGHHLLKGLGDSDVLFRGQHHHRAGPICEA